MIESYGNIMLHRLVRLSAFALVCAASPASYADNVDTDEQVKHPGYQSDGAYFTDIGTLLYHDRDRDGYFAGLSLTIDADTPNTSDRVYVSIDLIGPNQTIEQLHTTADFTIYEDSFSDEYQVDIDLIRNYFTANYDLEIRLHNARNDRLLDRVGSEHFNNLRQLPLESEDFDLQPASPANDNPPQTAAPNDDIRVSEYGGSTGLALLSLLLAGFLRKISRCRRSS